MGRAARPFPVPAPAEHEAIELPRRRQKPASSAKAFRKAVKKRYLQHPFPASKGKNPLDPVWGIDKDHAPTSTGTETKSKLGANCHLAGFRSPRQRPPPKSPACLIFPVLGATQRQGFLPVPMANVINGGAAFRIAPRFRDS